ncbi:MAG: hypothetical protein CGW95_11525 [Phenylobacterium zucineum]|nr:MAG: hypothetical protein CGW95_11525 [Phenylobacterium zucineum]
MGDLRIVSCQFGCADRRLNHQVITDNNDDCAGFQTVEVLESFHVIRNCLKGKDFSVAKGIELIPI